MNYKIPIIIFLSLMIIPAFAEEQSNPTLSMVNFDIDYNEFNKPARDAVIIPFDEIHDVSWQVNLENKLLYGNPSGNGVIRFYDATIDDKFIEIGMGSIPNKKFWIAIQLPDDEGYESLGSCSESTPPVQELDAHVAALGLKFYTGSMFPDEYKNQIFIAEHGSWNRSKKSGYRITLVRLDGNRAVSYEVFADGWMKNEKTLGRPVDLLILPDGSVLLSDDDNGVIYQITYQQS